MMEDSQTQGWEQGVVSTLNPSATKTEQIRELVNRLVRDYRQAGGEPAGQSVKSVLAERDLAGHDLQLFETWLAEAHRYFREASQQKEPLTYASEWVLDNYYIIRQALRQIKEDLPV